MPKESKNLTLQMSKRQAGISLIELLVGIVIGLLTVAAALAAMMASRTVSGNVSDASQLQQQASQAFRTISQQIRQAGSVKLNLAAGKASTEVIDAADPVAFEASFAKKTDTLLGNDNPGNGEYSLKLAYQNYKEVLFIPTTDNSQFRDCLGQKGTDTKVESRFKLVKSEGAVSGDLKCAGADGTLQPVISNVGDLQIRYLSQTDAATGTPKMQYLSAAAVSDWSTVFAVEVCLEMVGNEVIDTAGSEYLNCAGDKKTRGNRMRLVFKNTFDIRSQGSIG